MSKTSHLFSPVFQALTGHLPFPWQVRLHDEWFAEGEIPPACTLPTGLGKTAVMPLWLIALAGGASLPRRLAYVVNRRTVVDQATNEAGRMRNLIKNPALAGEHEGTICRLRDALARLAGGITGVPLAISTLRGQLADNGEWSSDPSRPAIIIGTVDMIGSRLLFSGYGRGFKHRPLHAGFLAQDTLLVHDEAQLEPAFQKLIEKINAEQARSADFRPMRIMALTATPRDQTENVFELTREESAPPAVIPEPPTEPIHFVWRRLSAKKSLTLHPLDDERKTAEKVASLAMERARSGDGSAILAFVRKVEDVKRVTDVLRKADKKCQVEQLTGTMRGKERDDLIRSSNFQRFFPSSNRNREIPPAAGTVFLVCTSAGEVGLDISADHLVCDLTTFDSMAQRFGRVNRYGGGEAKIDVVHPTDFNMSGPDKQYQARRDKTLEILRKLDGDASPKALAALPLDARLAAFSPTPKILDATDILFDAWALTSACKRLTGLDTMPGRPPVADWLHGVPTEWQPPETQVAWRSEVLWIRPLLETYEPEDLLDVYPLKPHELLKDRSDRVLKELKQMASRFEGKEVPVWIEDDRGVEVTTLGNITQGKEDAIANRTVILPPFAGGLAARGKSLLTPMI